MSKNDKKPLPPPPNRWNDTKAGYYKSDHTRKVRDYTVFFRERSRPHRQRIVAGSKKSLFGTRKALKTSWRTYKKRSHRRHRR